MEIQNDNGSGNGQPLRSDSNDVRRGRGEPERGLAEFIVVRRSFTGNFRTCQLTSDETKSDSKI